jgi:regulator of replication initiation timing
MPAKTPVKKTAKTVKAVRAGNPRSALKPVKKAPKKITWDDVQAGFKELHEIQKETERTLKESQDEAWKAIRETQQAVKETQKNIGGLNNTLGSLVERIMTPDLPRKFKPLGFTFDKITTIKWASAGNIYAEIDGLLENGAQAMAVEVKTTLEIEDVNDHLKRMERIRKYADEHGDKREFLGAIAAMIINPKPKDYALKNGFFVIEPSGEDVKVIKPEGGLRVW